MKSQGWIETDPIFTSKVIHVVWTPRQSQGRHLFRHHPPPDKFSSAAISAKNTLYIARGWSTNVPLTYEVRTTHSFLPYSRRVAAPIPGGGYAADCIPHLVLLLFLPCTVESAQTSGGMSFSFDRFSEWKRRLYLQQ